MRFCEIGLPMARGVLIFHALGVFHLPLFMNTGDKHCLTCLYFLDEFVC